MKDRLSPGLIAGVLGDLFQLVYSWLVRLFGISDKTYAEYGKILLLYKPFKGILASIVCAK